MQISIERIINNSNKCAWQPWILNSFVHRSCVVFISAFIDLVVSSESGSSSSEEGAEFMQIQDAIALSLQEKS